MSTTQKNPVRFPEEFSLADYYLFDRLKDGLGDKTAIRYGDRAFTYSDVADRTRALTRYFQSIGVAREERVYTVLPDTPAFAWSFFATLAHGAVVAMGNPVAPTRPDATGPLQKAGPSFAGPSPATSRAPIASRRP